MLQFSCNDNKCGQEDYLSTIQGGQNMTWKKKLMKVAPLAVCGMIGSMLFASDVSAHGYIDNGRSSLCKQGLNKSCGPVQYEPQSVEGVGNFPQSGPADGQIAGGGVFPDLDVQTATRWHKVNMTGGKNTFTWTFTARHSTADWKYYITKKGWDPNKPLTRADLELITTVDGGAKQPPAKLSHVIDVPTDRTGYHIILGVWDIADTPNAFYQVVDVNLQNGGPVQPDTVAPSVPANMKSSTQTPTSVNLTWDAATDNIGVHHYELYRNGVKVQTVTGTSVTDTGLTANTAYTYTVKAVDAAGNASKESTVLSVKTLEAPAVDTVAPSAPTSLHSMGETDTTINLMWNESTDNVGVKQYEVYRNGVKVQTVTGTSVTDTGLTANTNYTYTVKAVDAAGNVSEVSNTFVIKTKEQQTTVTQWDTKKVYTAGNRAMYNGLEYEAKWWTLGEIPPTSSAWKLVSKVAIDWSTDKAYVGGERVVHDGLEYEAKWWTLGETPNDNSVWKLV
jgi:chitin-binding protein